MFTAAGKAENGRWRLFVGLTALELREANEGAGGFVPADLTRFTDPGIWLAIYPLKETFTPEETQTLREAVQGQMKHLWGTQNPLVVFLPPEDVVDLLKCEQKCFHCEPAENTDFILYVAKDDEQLEMELPMFGIELETVVRLEQQNKFSLN